jgi:uncharacterized protein with FMN-binding domain
LTRLIGEHRPGRANETGVSQMAKSEKSRKRKVLIIAGAVVLVVILVAAGLLIWITHGLSAYKKLPIGNIDLARLPDGTYRGSFSGGRWSNTVEVTVKDRRITNIRIVKDVEFKSPKVASELFRRVEQAQSPQVDTVTGSTVTSKAYLKSIENALNRQP